MLNDLIELIKKSFDIFSKYLNKYKPEIQKMQYTEFSCHELIIPDINGGGGVLSYSKNEIQKEIFPYIFEYLRQEIEKMVEFENVAKKIAMQYEKNLQKLYKAENGESHLRYTRYILMNLVKKLIRKNYEAPLSSEAIQRDVLIFLSEVELKPKKYKFTCYLSGIYLKQNSIAINENALIRKIKESDIYMIRPYYDDRIRIEPPSNISPSILELQMYARKKIECRDFLNRILNALRLYKLGAIDLQREIKIIDTMIEENDFEESGWIEKYPHYRYVIKENETEVFVRFINTVENILKLIADSKNYHISTALDRYNFALLESIPKDKRLMMAVMGLEALYINEHDEVSFRFRLRLTKLLMLLGLADKVVINKIKKAYVYRSDIVHGRQLSKEEMEDINKLLPVILNYLRVSLIIYICESKNYNKSDLIELIDNSIVDNLDCTKLSEILNKQKVNFKEAFE
jgi:hypothetical protein